MVRVTSQLVERAGFLVARAREAGVSARLFGGVAVAALLCDRQPQGCERVPGDIDIAAPAGERRKLTEVLEASGYHADRQFNALHGRERLLFMSPGGLRIDVVLGVLRMCHVIPLEEGFAGDGATLPPWLLLISKLQVVELTEKDRQDAAALLVGCDPDELETVELARLCAADWGLWRTVKGSLEAIAERPPDLTNLELRVLRETCVSVGAHVDRQPKSLAWRLRAKIGDRVRWYELPEP